MSANVYLITSTRYDNSEAARFLEDEGMPPLEESVVSRKLGLRVVDDGLSTIETAARLCYMSYKRGRRSISDFIKNLAESKHGSVFEHATFGMIFTGVSRSFTHELVRHRAGFAYSQLSQRFVDESRTEFVVPPAIRNNPEAARRFRAAAERARSAYEELASILNESEKKSGKKGTEARKSAREAARSTLPNATETKIFVTGNARAWRHFIEMRGSKHADAEMRELALKVLRVLQKASPALFYDFSEEILPNGTVVASVENSKI